MRLYKIVFREHIYEIQIIFLKKIIHLSYTIKYKEAKNLIYRYTVFF